MVKDVLEHIPVIHIMDELCWMRSHCKQMLVIVPLGDNGVYRIEEYGLDKTHVVIENEEWWTLRFIDAGFSINWFSHKVQGIKDNWYANNKTGNGFFLLSSNDYPKR